MAQPEERPSAPGANASRPAFGFASSSSTSAAIAPNDLIDPHLLHGMTVLSADGQTTAGPVRLAPLAPHAMPPVEFPGFVKLPLK
jgi:hypothetical protein